MTVRQGCGCHDQNLHLSGVGEAVRPSQEAQVLAGMSQSQVHAVLLAHLWGRGAHYLTRWPPALLGAPCVPMEAEILPMPRPFLLAPLLTLAFIAARFPSQTCLLADLFFASFAVSLSLCLASWVPRAFSPSRPLHG